MSFRVASLACIVLAAAAARADVPWVGFESPHVHPIDLVPGSGDLLVVNTADGRLERFVQLDGPPWLRQAGSVPVGLEPVSVRVRHAGEAWVVNRVSDSVSIVDLHSMRVVRSIGVGNEPGDVVFAGTPRRAFVSISGEDRVAVLDPADPGRAVSIPMPGVHPRSMSTDGSRVAVTLFGSGNRTTVVPADLVGSALSPYPGSPNPPPNAGAGFEPPMNPSLAPPPPAGLIVRRDDAGIWRDDQGMDWSAAVSWDVLDDGLATIDASTLAVTPVHGLMTVPFAVAMGMDGTAVVVGQEALNHVRYEPVVNGRFLRIEFAVVPPSSGVPAARGDLNPHLDYDVPSVPAMLRQLSIGDPRAIVLDEARGSAWVAGMGSSNVIECSLVSGARLRTIAVGQGPTGLAIDAPRGRLFTIDRFDARVSVIDLDAGTLLGHAAYHDSTSQVVRDGRPFLYDTHAFSGLGHVSCASCHIDARTDNLCWDLGNPQHDPIEFHQVCNLDLPVDDDGCSAWHPVKGPMFSQTLIGMSGTEPFHWRGDRAYIANFSHASRTMQGADHDMTEAELKDLQDFLSSIAPAPNPLRALDGGLPTTVDGGDPLIGADLFALVPTGGLGCVTCHGGPTGGGAAVVSPSVSGEADMLAVPHLTFMTDKRGFDSMSSSTNRRASGYGHDGTKPTLLDFLAADGGHFSAHLGAQHVRDVAAFLLCWDTGTHPAVGAQVTLPGDPEDVGRRDQLIARAAVGAIDLVAHVHDGFRVRSFAWSAAGWLADEEDAPWSTAALDALASEHGPATWTARVAGTGLAVLDRDGDGHRDGDELASCSDPADASSVPTQGCRADLALDDGVVDGSDLGVLIAAWGSSSSGADLDCDGIVGGSDLGALLAAWGACAGR
jgi:YVTN family beta-propeller protein